MRLFRWVIASIAIIAVAACYNTFKAGRCDKTSDCASMTGYAGYVCDLDPDIQGAGRCVPPCTATSDCQGGSVCNFDSQGVGRCLFPIDGGAGGASGGGGARASGGAGGKDAGEPDVNPCAACTGATPVCLQEMCVQCAASTDCSDPAKSLCNTTSHTCVDVCTTCGGSAPVCVQHACVQCAASSDCTTDATKPICDASSHICVACSSDAQCAAKLGPTGNPGVCMSQADGHCATDAETIYVANSAGCRSSYLVGAGTSSTPYCSMDPVAPALSATQSLVVIRGTVAGGSWTYAGGAVPSLTIVGQQTAAIASSTSPGFDMTAGTAYIRDLKFSPSATVGISASGGILTLDTVVVDSCQGGGILLDGAAFSISNTAVTNNGPGHQGAIAWGGILVTSLPASGPTTLNWVTVQGNKQLGLDCSAPIEGTGVLAMGNAGGDVAPACGVTACMPASSTCGAP